MSLKSKIFIGFIVSVMLMFSVLSFFTFNETSKAIINNEREMMEVLGQSIVLQMETELEAAKIGVLSMANNIDVQRNFADRNREELIRTLLPIYDSISSTVSQIQFHLPDSTSFLRLHSVEKFGDSLKDFRHTVNMANSTKEIVKGLEEGANGYGFRVVVPVFYEGVHIGSVEYGSEFGKQFLQDIKDSYPGEYFIYSLKNIGDPNLDSGSNVIASTTEDVWRIEDEEYMKSLEKGETVYLTTQDQNYNVVLIPFKDFNGEIKGYYKVVNDRIETVDSINAIKRNSILITGALLLILVSIFYILLTRLLKPIGLLIDAIEEVAAGDLTKKIEVQSKDELRALADTFNKMIISLKEVISQSGNISEQVAAISEELSAASEEVTASAEEVTNTIVDVSKSAEKQFESIEESKGIMDEMIRSIKVVSKNIENVHISSKNTLDSAEEGIVASQNAVHKMDSLKVSTERVADEIYRLNESSKEIEKIVITISSIADQTNLLALNAAIEAARAGESGRGFSVVAEEVRKLAEESAKSSQHIGQLIMNIQTEINQIVQYMMDNSKEVALGVDIVAESSRRFSDILTEINTVATQILEVEFLAEELSNSASEVTLSFDELSKISYGTVQASENVVTSSEQQTGAMEEVASATTDLATMASQLRDSISVFKY